MEDGEIIALFWQRSETALAATERKYSKYCYAIALGILQNNEDAQECVNDTLARAWGAIPPARPGVLRTFLGRITRNLALNALEKMQTEKRGSGQAPLPLSELEQCLAGKDEIPGEIDEITRVIDCFLERLDSTQRRVFVQRYWYAGSLEDIAGDCGMTVNKAKSILFRLRKKLKDELTKEGVFL